MNGRANAGWKGRLRSFLPSPESIRANRFLAPFADRLTDPALWKPDPVSVPRGLALGTFFAGLLPVGHSVVATLVAPWVRANIVAAIAATWLINPVTMPLYYLGAYRLGAWVMDLFHLAGAPGHVSLDLPQAHAPLKAWWHWAETRIEPLTIGVVLLSLAGTVLIYALAIAIARIPAARKWLSSFATRTSPEGRDG